MTEYGLIGYPLGHSFSQRFFREKFTRENIDADYLNFETEDISALRSVIAQHPTLCGLNVTIPHKQAVMHMLDEIDIDAAAIGAVNTIFISPQTQKLIGFNTDHIGFSESIKPLLKPCHEKALVLGTGGASKAIVFALQRLGITPTYVSRSISQSSLHDKAATSEQCTISRMTYADITPEVMAEHKLIINCTPLGMYPKTDVAPEIPYRSLTSDHLLYDLVYNPPITRFMALGRKQGAVVKNGQEMLERQAIASYNIWTHNSPKI